MPNIAVIVGSLRKESLNLKLAHALQGLVPEDSKLEIVEIGAMPHYNEDLETATPPEAWTAFRAAIRAHDAVLFLTPEYNRAIPGVLKNAIDVGSRPWGHSIWAGKPSAIISLSPGAIGGFGANHQLRQSLSSIGVPILPTPEAYIGNAGQLFAPDGSIAVESTRDFLKGFLTTFCDWIGRVRK